MIMIKQIEQNACITLRRDLLLPDPLLSAEASEVIAKVQGAGRGQPGIISGCSTLI